MGDKGGMFAWLEGWAQALQNGATLWTWAPMLWNQNTDKLCHLLREAFPGCYSLLLHWGWFLSSLYATRSLVKRTLGDNSIWDSRRDLQGNLQPLHHMLRQRESTSLDVKKGPGESNLTVLKKPCSGASLIAQLVKNLPAMQETPVWFLGREDLLEKG